VDREGLGVEGLRVEATFYKSLSLLLQIRPHPYKEMHVPLPGAGYKEVES
jgi:hypothetical protein